MVFIRYNRHACYRNRHHPFGYYLFERSYDVPVPKSSTHIKLHVRSRDHACFVHVHFTIDHKNYEFSLESWKILYPKNCKRKIDADIENAIRSFCKDNETEIRDDYYKGKGGCARMPKQNNGNEIKESTSLVYSPEQSIIDYGDSFCAVRDVLSLSNYVLQLVFEDGKRGYYDMLPIILQEDGGDATFVPLKDIKLFMRAHVDEETVGWTDDISIAAEELYDYCMTEAEYEQWLIRHG